MDIRRRNSLRIQRSKASHYRWRKGHSRRSRKSSSCTTERQCLYSVGKGNKELRNICKVFLKKTCFHPSPPIFCLRSRLGKEVHSAKCISCFCEKNVGNATFVSDARHNPNKFGFCARLMKRSHGGLSLSASFTIPHKTRREIGKNGAVGVG